jgi:sulfide dehydrogenase cytochrome subunit
LHKKNCAKCHDENGSLADDDAGILASQWAPYLKYSLMDTHAGTRSMPKKMTKKVKALSDADIDALVHFYASQQ